jgi:LmbE family N-acetylglucosaminyl deacetylase
MNPAMVISPHLDDAVLSVGQVMAGRPEMTVVTVFSGVPQDCQQTNTYDVNCGFASAAEAITARRAEDREALRILDADPVWLDFVDDQYNEPAGEADITARLLSAAAVTMPTLLIGPLGLSHPDHLITRRTFQRLVAATGIEAWVYEDLPYRVLCPEEVPEALAWWKEKGHRPELGFVGTGPLERKREALSHYRSQMWAIDALSEHAYLCPERLWRLR